MFMRLKITVGILTAFCVFYLTQRATAELTINGPDIVGVGETVTYSLESSTSPTWGCSASDKATIDSSTGVLTALLVPSKSEGDVTVTVVDGKDQGSKNITIAKITARVDANRDGEINFDNSSDKTSAATSFRFWLNDDDDSNESHDTVPVQTKDGEDSIISTKRDLEDFTRLWLEIKGVASQVKDGKVQVAFKWEGSQGSPTIKVYRAFETDGGKEYLENDDKASSQISGGFQEMKFTVSGNSPVILDSQIFSDLSEENSKIYFIVEASGGGAGKLVPIIMKNNEELVKGSSVDVSLKKVTEMYSKARGMPASGIDSPHAFFPGQPQNQVIGFSDETASNFEKPTDEAKQCIVFLHGWNVNEARYEQQAVAAFKRLWLVGFKGRYASFRWPSNVAGENANQYIRLFSNATAYFDIEYRAFKYANALKEYVHDRSAEGFAVGLLGHSMGNIISSEAKLQGATASTYVLLNGAVSASCYDESDLLTQNSEGNNFNPPTPRSEPDFTQPHGGYRGYFKSLTGLTSFFNENDSALRAWAQVGNTVKRNQWNKRQPGAPNYSFEVGRGVLLNIRPLIPSSPMSDPREAGPPIGHAHESMTMFAESRTLAVGAESRTGGAIANPKMISDFLGVNQEHSGAFDRSIQFNDRNGIMGCYRSIREELFP